MTSEHVRAARMLLRWEQKELARKSGVSLPTIKRLEARPGVLGAYPDTIVAIRKTFEDQGIEFFNGDAPGVWLRRGRKPPPAPAEPTRASKPAGSAKTAPPKGGGQRRS
jgi:DNA-binding XRE family transcriptional regulator